MKKFFYSVISLVLVCLCLTGCAKNVSDESVDMSLRQIATEDYSSVSEMLTAARSAVVGISATYKDGYAIGSGVAISDGGLILTNNHVVEGGGKITLYYADKTTGSGKVLWTDPGMDMAVVQSSREIPYLGIDTSETVIGEEVFALGTPLTLEFKHTVTHGIVSATNRTLEVASSAGTSFLQSLIQHDASINPGNSGGPLINRQGKVIGINTLKATEGEGIGFAIPIKVGSVAVSKLKTNPQFQSAYLGVFGFDSEIAMAHGEKLDSVGVYVSSVDGPALKAGLKKGDLLTKIGEKDVTNLLSLKEAVLGYNQGDSVKISVIRDGKRVEFLATLK